MTNICLALKTRIFAESLTQRGYIKLNTEAKDLKIRFFTAITPAYYEADLNFCSLFLHSLCYCVSLTGYLLRKKKVVIAINVFKDREDLTCMNATREKSPFI